MPAVKNLAADVEIRKLGLREKGMPTPYGHGTRDESVTMILPPSLFSTTCFRPWNMRTTCRRQRLCIATSSLRVSLLAAKGRAWLADFGSQSPYTKTAGIFRPVQLLITPKVFVERVDVEATPNLTGGDATIAITSYIRNTSRQDWSGQDFLPHRG
jgi:hypothetical protein